MCVCVCVCVSMRPWSGHSGWWRPRGAEESVAVNVNGFSAGDPVAPNDPAALWEEGAEDWRSDSFGQLIRR